MFIKKILISEKELLSIIREQFIKHISNINDDFNLNEYLNTIPKEELKNQYEDYQQYENINGFDIIQQILEDVKNNISSAKQAKQNIMSKLGLKDWQVLIKKVHNHVEVIIIYAGIFRNKKIIKQEMLNNGFFDSKEWFAWRGIMLWKAIKFEPQNQRDVTVEAKRFGVLYHLSTVKNVSSIEANGLIPSHRNSFFRYPNRVYVLKGNIDPSQITYLGEQLYKKDKNNPDNNGEYVLYKIDVSQIPNDVKFYGDPNYLFGYFTYDKIPSSALTIIQKYNFNK